MAFGRRLSVSAARPFALTMARALLAGLFLSGSVPLSAAQAQNEPDVSAPNSYHEVVTTSVLTSILGEFGFATEMAQAGTGTLIVATREGEELIAYHESCSGDGFPDCAIVVWGEALGWDLVPGVNNLDKLSLVGFLNSDDNLAGVQFSADPENGILLASRLDLYVYGGNRGNIAESLRLVSATCLDIFPIIPQMQPLSTTLPGQMDQGQGPETSLLPDTSGLGLQSLLSGKSGQVSAGSSNPALRNLALLKLFQERASKTKIEQQRGGH